jgi:photosystem II stability/assembly factor-like uncharacterized protein
MSGWRDLKSNGWIGILVMLPLLQNSGEPRPASRTTAVAQAPSAIDTTLLRSYRWRSLGPDRGGRSLTVSGVKGQPKVGYFGATGGGLWRTTDGGENWAPITDGQIRSSSVGAMAVSMTNPEILYIGMGEACIRGNIQPGDGVYRSADGGKTWTHIGFGESDAIAKIRVDPRDPDVVYVASFGRYGAPSEERGLYKSTNGGETWKRVLFRDNRTGAVDIAIDPHRPDVMYAALWEAYRVEYQMSSGGPGSGLFKSTDGGETWKEITRNPGLPAGVDGRIGVAVSGADGNRVYAIVENEDGGLFSSDDAGATWERVNDDRSIRQRAFYYTHVVADPNDRDKVYVLNVGTFVSTDGGRTLERFAGGDSHDLWVDPDDSDHVLHASDGGGAVTFNASNPQRTWTARDYPTGQYYHVVATAHVPFHVCGAQQDGSTVCVPSSMGQGGGRGGFGGRGGGAPGMYSPGGSEPAYIAPDPTDPDVFYSGGNNGSFLIRTDRRSGNSREVNPYPRMFSGEESAVLVERWQWTYPIVFSPVDPRVLYTSSQHVWKTTNGGQSWDRISPDLTRHDAKTMGPSGGPITRDMNAPEVYATVFALGPSKVDVNVLWAGSDDGRIHVTRDGGATWTNVTPPDMPEFGRVSIIDASAFDAGTAYVAVKRPLLADFSPWIFRTHDFGRTWSRIVTGIRADDYVHSVREDPTRQGLLYAGTQHGFYISYDDGDTWSSLSLNLPDVQVSDLIVEGDAIAIATHGRGFYILDNIGPLRQYRPEMAINDQPVLFRPPSTIRSAGNAEITYWLKRPASELRIEILDGSGAVVETIEGARPQSGRGSAAGGRGGRGRGEGAARGEAGSAEGGADATAGRGRGGRGGPAGAPVGRGLHTVTWNLQYPDAETFEGMILWGATTSGPTALPGAYQVRMTADGTSLTEPLVIEHHPLRGDISDEDLRAQFDLAIRIRDKVSEANRTVTLIRRIRSDVESRSKDSRDARLKSAADRLLDEIASVEEAIYQVRNRSGQDPLNFPIRINNRLASLLRAVTRGDGRPIASAGPIFNDLSAELKVQTDQLDTVLVRDLLAFNAEARRLGLPEVSGKPGAIS